LAVVVPWALDARQELALAGVRGGAENDEAVLELAAHDTLAGDPPRGAYSRFGWHHPGPLPIYVLAVGVRLFGADGHHWITGLVSLGCLLTSLLLMARRHGPAPTATFVLVVALGVGAVARHVLPSVFFSVWNPVAAVAPLVLLWTLALESPRLGSWALAAATLTHAYVVQAHVGYALVATFLWGACVTVPLRRRPGASPWIGAVVVGAVAWSSLIDTWPNLLAMLRFVRSSPEVGIAPVEGLVLAARRTQEVWLGSEGSDELALAGFGLQLLLLGSHLAQCWSCDPPAPVRVLAIAAGTLLLAVVSACGVDSPHHAHQTFWMMLVGPLAWWAAVWPLIARRRRPAVPFAAVALAALLALAWSHPGRARYEEWAGWSRPQAGWHAALADGVAARLGRGPCVLLIGDHDLWGWAAGVAVALERRGRRVHLDPRFDFMFGLNRARVVPSAGRLMLSRSEQPGWRVVILVEGVYLLERAPLDSD
jgi:hypothetical protein